MAAAAGPPFPPPVDGQAVYDTAGILSPATIANAEATIDAIEARTAAEIVVYTQLVDYGVTTEETEARARALIDQWGVGRRGFDDGLAIFFDIDPSLEHGQVQLYAAPGFEATFLTNAERQAIFDDDMLPYLRNADFDGALDVALERIDAAATPENAARLQTARQVNAVLGLVGAPIAFLGLAGWAFMSWRRYGKDPVYLDDPSILMPAPPPDLTAASGAFVMDGRHVAAGADDRDARSRVARPDLVPRGSTACSGCPTRSASTSRRHARGRRGSPPGAQRAATDRAGGAVRAEGAARARRRGQGRAHRGRRAAEVRSDRSGTFDSKLEAHVVERGWMVEKPSKVVARWTAKGVLAIVAGGDRADRRHQRPDLGPRADRGRDHRRRHRDRRCSPRACRRSRCPAP